MTTVDVVVRDAAGHASTPVTVTIPVSTGTWDPASTPNLELGFYPIDTSTVETYFPNAPEVFRVHDISPYGRHMTAQQGGPAGRNPLTNTLTTPSGANCVYFDGVDDGLFSPPFTHGAPATIFAALKADAVNGGNTFYGTPDTSDHVLRCSINLLNETWRMRNSDGQGSGKIALDWPADTDWHIITMVYDGANSVLRIDGVTRATGQSGTNGAYTTRRGVGINGTWGGAWNPFAGPMAVLLHCSGRSSDATITTTEAGLSSATGIPLGV